MGDKKALLILTSSNTTLSTKTQFCCLLLFADNVYRVYITALCAGWAAMLYNLLRIFP